jgi:hypothetical protein
MFELAYICVSSQLMNYIVKQFRLMLASSGTRAEAVFPSQTMLQSIDFEELCRGAGRFGRCLTSFPVSATLLMVFGVPSSTLNCCDGTTKLLE